MKRFAALVCLAAFVVVSPASPAKMLEPCPHHAPLAGGAPAGHGSDAERAHAGHGGRSDPAPQPDTPAAPVSCTCMGPCQGAAEAAVPAAGETVADVRPADPWLAIPPAAATPAPRSWLLPFANAPPASSRTV